MYLRPLDRRSTMLCLMLLGLCWLAPSARAQPGEKPRTVIKQTLYAEPEDLLGILSLLDLELKTMPQQNTLVMRGPSNDIESALKLIENLDRPRQDLEVELFILGAGPAGAAPQPQTPSPGGLAPLFERLRSLFGLENLTLLDTLFLRTQDGKGGQITGGVGAPGQRTSFVLSFERARIVPLKDAGAESPGREGSLLRFQGLRFQYGDSDSTTGSLATLRTDIEVGEGQRAVVGRSTPRGEGQTLILVIRAKILP